MANEYYGDFVQSKMATEYVSLATMVSSIGSTPTLVRMNQSFSPTSNVTLPTNIFLEWDGTSVIAPSSGTIVTLGSTPRNVSHRIFTGLGQVRFSKTGSDARFLASWCLPDATAGTQSITAAQSEMMRYWLYLNNGGTLVFPVGTFNIDHDFLLQIGTVEGSAQNPNIHGTIINQVTESEGLFTFLPGARDVTIRNMVLRCDGLTDGAQFYCYSSDASPQTIDGIRIENVACEGGSENFRVFHDHANKNWQVHNVYINEQCDFMGATVASIRIDAINAGGYCAANLRPDPNGVSWAFEGETFAKWQFEPNGQGVQGSQVGGGEDEAIQFTFTSSDVNTGTDRLTKVGHGLSTGDSVYLSNSGGALPTGLSAATKYWVRRVDADNLTFHPIPGWAIDGTNIIDITAGGSGTNTLYSSRTNPDAQVGQPAGMYHISGPFAEGLVISGLQRDEGIPIFLKVDAGLDENYAAPIDCHSVHTLGQTHLLSNCHVNLFGGFYRPNSFKDADGVAAVVHNFGARPFENGVGTGDYAQYGGYVVPAPYRLDDFQGDSYFATYFSHFTGAEFTAGANDTPIATFRVWNNESLTPLKIWLERISSGVKAGWFKLQNSMFGVTNAQAGLDIEGGLAYAGRLMNARPADAATGTSGTITLDLSLGHVFTVTPTGNATIELTNGPASHTMHFYLVILTSGTSSYDLSQGTLSVMQAGAFATGTVSGALYVLEYFWNGTYGIETGRNPSAGNTITNAQDDGNNLQLDNDALITSAYHGGSIGFHQDTTQEAIRITPDSPGALTPGYVKVFNVTNGSNEDVKMQFVPETDGDAIIDVYQADLSLQLSGSTALKIDESITATHTRLLIYDVDNGTLERVTVGAADSGGSGFKVLRIPN